MSNKRIFGLIGEKLSHSFSPTYFSEKFKKEGIVDAVYLPFPLETIHDFPKLLQSQPSLAGLNVTIPYKEQIIPYLDQLSPAAAEIGAVNTIEFAKNGILVGHNTDVIGFENCLISLLNGRSDVKSALILGTGGAAKAVAYVLKRLEISYLFVSRNASNPLEIPYSFLDEATMQENLLIINTTPLGMYPHIEDAAEISYNMIHSKHILYDLIYNPTETVFLKKGKEKGAMIQNGLSMLWGQAEAAWAIWNDKLREG